MSAASVKQLNSTQQTGEMTYQRMTKSSSAKTAWSCKPKGRREVKAEEEMAVADLMELERAKMGLVLVAEDEKEEKRDDDKGKIVCLSTTSSTVWE
jgi:hypothetical protein